jgi:hypothetical protein
MSTQNNNPSKSYKDMNCIWMTSGLVKYKLCDKEFDCENCEFDRVFRNASAKTAEKNIPQNNNSADLVDKLIKRIENVNYDSKLIYLKNQLVMKNLFGNAYYLGINPVLMYLLEDYRDVHEFHTNDIKQNQIILTFEGSWGFKQFASPINFLIIEKVNSLDFKTNQWYSIVLFNPADNENYIMEKNEWDYEKEKLLTKLQGYIVKRPHIGTSMADGGDNLVFLHQYIGKREYNKLLNMFFL